MLSMRVQRMKRSLNYSLRVFPKQRTCNGYLWLHAGSLIIWNQTLIVLLRSVCFHFPSIVSHSNMCAQSKLRPMCVSSWFKWRRPPYPPVPHLRRWAQHLSLPQHLTLKMLSAFFVHITSCLLTKSFPCQMQVYSSNNGRCIGQWCNRNSASSCTRKSTGTL